MAAGNLLCKFGYTANRVKNTTTYSPCTVYHKFVGFSMGKPGFLPAFSYFLPIFSPRGVKEGC